jgi:hypothetical protein
MPLFNISAPTEVRGGWPLPAVSGPQALRILGFPAGSAFSLSHWQGLPIGACLASAWLSASW